MALIVFEENGFPAEPHPPREIERAVTNGRLRASTIVRTGFEDGAPQTSRAEEVAFLRPLLGIVDAALPTPEPAPQPETGPPPEPAPPRPPVGTQGNVSPWSAPPRPAAAIEAKVGTPFAPVVVDQAPARRVLRADDIPGKTPPRAPHPRAATYRQPASGIGCAVMPLIRYAQFDGRSSRLEFWGFMLFQLIALGVLVASNSPVLFVLIALALIVPNLAVSVRRLHDHNRTGWLVLLGIIPYLGAVIVAVLMLLAGDHGDNRFGPNPAH